MKRRELNRWRRVVGHLDDRSGESTEARLQCGFGRQKFQRMSAGRLDRCRDIQVLKRRAGRSERRRMLVATREMPEGQSQDHRTTIPCLNYCKWNVLVGIDLRICSSLGDSFALLTSSALVQRIYRVCSEVFATVKCPRSRESGTCQQKDCDKKPKAVSSPSWWQKGR
jgi:hypothetical protein